MWPTPENCDSRHSSHAAAREVKSYWAVVFGPQPPSPPVHFISAATTEVGHEVFISVDWCHRADEPAHTNAASAVSFCCHLVLEGNITHTFSKMPLDSFQCFSLVCLTEWPPVWTNKHIRKKVNEYIYKDWLYVPLESYLRLHSWDITFITSVFYLKIHLQYQPENNECACFCEVYKFKYHFSMGLNKKHGAWQTCLSKYIWLNCTRPPEGAGLGLLSLNRCSDESCCQCCFFFFLLLSY